MVDLLVVFVALGFALSLFAVSFLRAIPGWVANIRAVRALRRNDNKEGMLLQGYAILDEKVSYEDLCEEYSQEEVNCFGRMLIIASIEKKLAAKRAKIQRKEERIAALYVKDAVRTAKKLERSERSRQAWARKKAAQVEVQMAA